LHAKARTINTRTGDALASAEDADPLKLALYATYSEIVEKRELRKVLCCTSCGMEGIQARHRCPDKMLTPAVALRDVEVSRWYWKEPFNPDSPAQVLGYLKYRKHKPGRNKKTKKDTTDRDTLQRLMASTGDPFYEVNIEIRALGKVRGTYAVGVRKRLDANDRFHSTFTLRPSTLRTSAVAPNIQTVVGDKDKAQTLAAGFRDVIVADQEPPEWTKDWTPAQLAEYR
jgi:hypothetical protein